MSQHEAKQAVPAQFQFIVSLVALAAVAFTDAAGNQQFAEPSIPLGDFLVGLGEQVTLYPVPTMATLDDVAATQVQVPSTATIGDVVVLEADGSVPATAVAGETFFTAAEWETLIVPGTEVDTPDAPAVVEDITDTAATPAVDPAVVEAPVQADPAPVDASDTTTPETVAPVDPSAQAEVAPVVDPTQSQQ